MLAQLPKRVRSVFACTCALVVLTLSACTSLEPGMRLGELGDPGAGRPTAAPKVTLITPALLQEENRVRGSRSRQDIQTFVGVRKPYVIGNGDLLSILVWNHPELNIAAAGAQALSSSSTQGLPSVGAQTPSAYVVDQEGQVQFPFVGTVKLAGLTELQARDLLSRRLLASIKRPDITLRVLQFRSKKVYVDGEVKTPGNQSIDDVPMTLLESLTRAGGLLPTADQSSIQISRDGKTQQVDIPLLVGQGINPSDILLADGDVVRVKSRDENKIYVLGEVTTPKAIPMVNGRLSLTQALGEAGGLNQLSASGKQVYVVRDAGTQEQAVFNLDAQSPVALALADGFQLSPRDVVFVDASGLARFNRVLSLIIPNAAGAAATYYNVNTR